MSADTQNRQFLAEAARNSGRAFPHVEDSQKRENIELGLTARQYAAIKLRVPDSGDEWLDAMILTSLRDDLAAKALQGVLSGKLIGSARDMFKFADEMIAERSK